MKKNYIQPCVKSIGIDQALMNGNSIPFGEGKKSAEEADAEEFSLFDNNEEQNTVPRNCWNDEGEW